MTHRSSDDSSIGSLQQLLLRAAAAQLAAASRSSSSLQQSLQQPAHWPCTGLRLLSVLAAQQNVFYKRTFFLFFISRQKKLLSHSSPLIFWVIPASTR
eukprot:COSAG01_NODE_96_length_26789_cov_36.697089_16_plen_98_part_00